MKITQLDFSAIRAANSVQANANSAAIAVAQSRHNALATQYNVDYTKKYVDAVNKENNTKSWINFGVGLANIALKGAEIGIKLKDQADGETASNSLTDAATQLENTYRTEYTNNAASFFDADNNIVKPQAIIDQENALKESIQNLSIGNEKKQQALNALDEMFNTAWSDVGVQLAEREITARNESWTTRLNEALEVDSKLGSPDNGLGMIQNTEWLTPAEKNSYSLQYQNSFDSRIRANETSRLARVEGQASANEYINNLVDSGEITEDEWLTLSALANKVGGEEDANAAQNAVQYASEQLELGVFPGTINEQLKPQLEAMDNERREYVQKQLNSAYYQHALEEFSWPSDLTTLTGPELRDLKADVEERGSALLPDMPAELSAMRSSIQKELDTRTTANAESNVQSMDLVFDAVGAGTISPAQGLAMIRELPIYDDSDTSDDEKAAEYMKKIGNVESLVPTHVQYTYKNRISLLEDSIKETLGLDTENPDENGIFIRYADQARSYVLDYVWNTPAEEITAASLNEAFDKATEIFLGGTIQELEEVQRDNEGRTLIQQGFSNLGAGYLEDVTDILMQMPEGMISRNPDGSYDSSSMLVSSFWNELDIAERNLVQQLNLGNPNDWTTVPYRRINEDGTTTEVPIPVLQSSDDGTRYTIIGNEFMKQENDSEQWEVVTAINRSTPLPVDDTITPLTPAQVRKGQQSLDISNPPSLDSYRDPWVMPSPDAVRQGQRSVVIDDDAGAFAHLAREGGDVRVRRGRNDEMQFWDNGRWYLVDELPENSPILRAYYAYMATFSGSIPRAGK